MIHHLVSAVGFLAFAGIAWLLSSNRRRVSWKTIGSGMALQLLLGTLIFRLPGSHRAFLWMNDAVLALLNASKAGTAFLFGPLAAAPGEPESVGFILIFQVLPVAIFFAAFTAALYHLRVLQWLVRLFARLFHRTMAISGAESLCGAANIFVGVESALVIRPYLAGMTRSELLCVLTTGMGTVASSTLGVYVAFLSGAFPEIAGHLESTRSRNLMGAIIEGAMDGLKLAAGITALLIAVLGLVALGDKVLGVASPWFGLTAPLSLVRILSWIFKPFAYLLGIQASDVPVASRLLGERVILTEVVSYRDLAQLLSSGGVTDPRTVVILSYALCGFAHVASVAIFVGGTAALTPSRRDDLAALGWRALLAATLATLMAGCVAGIFSTGEGVLLTRPGT
ncbi:MAG: hypothetical protein DMG10_17150 [Acidobacteria bacterium]|nr:MAG: hypothetical protein DMG10_17150 [Acidobacteriota bacterium]